MTAENATNEDRAIQVDEETREGLVDLARKVDDARKAANAIEIVAGTNHAYGHLSNALYKVLKTITGNAATADLLYNSIAFDGNTVDEAFAWMKTNQA